MHVIMGGCKDEESQRQAVSDVGELTSLRPAAVEGVLRGSTVRREAVARARVLLASSAWCRSEEVADELVECYVGRRLP